MTIASDNLCLKNWSTYSQTRGANVLAVHARAEETIVILSVKLKTDDCSLVHFYEKC